MQHTVLWVARIALFVELFWFGLLKVLFMSPAYDLVVALQTVTLPFIASDTFFIILGVAEMAIGIGFLFPKLARYVLPVFFLHMSTTFLPLIFLPAMTWSAPFAPTLAGQYIIKNLVLVALALQIAVVVYKTDIKR